MSEDKNPITVFAKTNFRNKEVPFGIKADDRRRHMYVIGKTGMGKTTLMENMAIQDIHNGHGLAFLDPHGDSVQRILDCVPNSRINDVIYFNPSDLEFPVAFNILEAVDTKYKHLVASGLMGVFTKIWANLWSARMEYILNNTILALLDSPGNTLLGITRMYVDKKYRKKIVDNIKDPMVRAFWVDEFANYNEKYRTEAIAPIQNKVGQFLSSGIIRNIVGQPRSTIDLREIMDDNKILIMDLSKGKVGEDNSALLGAMIVTKLQLAALSRADIPEAERKDFYLYVDEFQNFATESFATILSEARKYRLNLTVGHQYIAQLEQDKNTKVRDAIFGNVGTMVVFRVGAADAEFMETEFDPTFLPTDLVNLPKYSIILKLMINGVASEPFSATTLGPNPDHFTGNGQKVIKVSRERYSNPVLEVEDKISRWMSSDSAPTHALLAGDNENVDAELAPINEVVPPKLQFPKRENSSPQKMEIPLAVPNFVLPPPTIPKKHEKNFAETPLQPQPVFNRQPPVIEKASAMVFSQPAIFNRPRQQSQPRTSASASQSSRRPENSRKEFSERRESRPNQNNNDHSRNRKPEVKKQNPIWDTVASLHTQKVQQEQKKIKETVSKILTEPDEQPSASSFHESLNQPFAKAPEPTPITQKVTQTFEPQSIQKPQQHDDRKIMKPGESHKFN